MSRNLKKIEQNTEKILSEFIETATYPPDKHQLSLWDMLADNILHCTMIRAQLLQILEEAEMIESNLCRVLYDIIDHAFQDTPQQINKERLLAFNANAMKKEIEWVQLLLTKIREKTTKQEYIMIRQAALFLSRKTQQLRDDAVAAAAETVITTMPIPRLG